MNKLSELRVIRDKLIAGGKSNLEAIEWIADKLDREPLTVYTWLSESQRLPIPDNLLQLLKLLTSSSTD